LVSQCTLKDQKRVVNIPISDIQSIHQATVREPIQKDPTQNVKEGGNEKKHEPARGERTSLQGKRREKVRKEEKIYIGHVKPHLGKKRRMRSQYRKKDV